MLILLMNAIYYIYDKTLLLRKEGDPVRKLVTYLLMEKLESFSF